MPLVPTTNAVRVILTSPPVARAMSGIGTSPSEGGIWRGAS
jgi:hypothetical protein